MSLLKPKFEYKPINREQVDGKRLYATPDGSKVPSVTTILDKTKSEESKLALARWRKSVGEAKAQQITVEAAGRGTRMHKFLEDYVTTGTMPLPGTNPFSQQSNKMATVIREQGLIHVDEFWGLELPLYYEGLYAGTTDCVGVWKGQEAIIDYKQTNKPKKREYIDDYFTQLTAYAQAHNKMHGTNIRTGVILMCSAEFQYQEFVIELDEFDKWANVWWNRVEQYYKEN